MKKIHAMVFVLLIALLGAVTVACFPASAIKELCAAFDGGTRGVLWSARGHTALSDKLAAHVAWHDRWIDLYGGVQRAAGADAIPDRDTPVYRLRDGRVTFVCPDNVPLSGEETAGIQTLKRAADAVSARSMFVVIPRKTCAQYADFAARGVRSCAEDVDSYRKGVFADAGFETLDLHEKLHSEGKAHASMYFRTDHHWTAHTGLWAAKEIGDALGLDTTALNPSQYATQTYPGIFLGAEGKLGGRLYCTPDDMDVLLPKFDTALTLTADGGAPRSGSFREALLFPDHLTPKPYSEYFPYRVYLNGDHGSVRIQNRLQPNGLRVLLFKDSFSNSMAPYLSLCCAQVDMIDLRHYEGSAAAYVAGLRPDVVCVTISSACLNEVFVIN